MVPSPGLDLGSGIVQRQEPVGVQALVAQAAVEALDERIIGRLARAAEVERYAVLIGPAVQCLRDKLRAIVHPYASRTTQRNGRYAVCHSGGKHGYFAAPIAAVSAPPSCFHSFKAVASTTSIPRLGSPTSLPASPVIRLIGLAICSHGIGNQQR